MLNQFSTPVFGDSRLPPRFWSKVKVSPTGCWIWLAAVNNQGYAFFGCRSRGAWRMELAHRVAYAALVEPFPPGTESDHLCRVRACVNPDHIEPVTHSVNRLRGANSSSNRTHCPRGHPYNEANTYHYPDGRRGCRTCHREGSKRWMRKWRARYRTPTL